MSREEQIESIENKQFIYKKLTENVKHSQEWPEYNEAQTKEKLLNGLLRQFLL